MNAPFTYSPFDDASGKQLLQFLAQHGIIGTNGGTVTLNGATPVSVTNANIAANSVVTFTLKTVHGTVGAAPNVKTITPGTGFTVAGTALDTSVYNYVISTVPA